MKRERRCEEREEVWAGSIELLACSAWAQGGQFESVSCE